MIPKGKFNSIDEYHAAFPKQIRNALAAVRKAIRAAAPKANESISYNMPCFKMNKVLVYYAGYEKHIGFYPMPAAIKYFTDDLKKFKTSKGAIQFPLNKPLPAGLIKKIVKFRVAEDQATGLASKKKLGVNKDLGEQGIKAYHAAQTASDKVICETLYEEISKALPAGERKIWHAHPVWFLDGNPVVGYSKLKDGIRLLFWSGQSFDEQGLANEGSFKAAEIRYRSEGEIKKTDLRRWLKKARDIQWDYKNIVKRKGQLIRLK